MTTSREATGSASQPPAVMPLRSLGRSDLVVSAVGLACGRAGGQEGPAVVERAVRRALDLGVDYFDAVSTPTSSECERDLGAALRASKVSSEVHVGVGFRLWDTPPESLRGSVRRSLEDSLRRLDREYVDVLYLCDPIAEPGDGVPAREVLGVLRSELEPLVEEGKVRLCGITALGSRVELARVIDAGVFAASRVGLDLLTADGPLSAAPEGLAELLSALRAAGTGLVASCGRESPPRYTAELARLPVLRSFVEDGSAADWLDAAVRISLGLDAVSCVLVSDEDPTQLERAAASAARGPLGVAAPERSAATGRFLE